MKYEEMRELHDLLFGTVGLFHEKFIHQLRKESRNYTGIKKNHTMIIGFLYQKQVLTATEIAKMLNMEKGSLTTLIDQLEGFGLVNRCEDHNDRRKSLISLTEAGKAEMEDLMSDSTRRIGEILGSADPDDLKQFVDNLRYNLKFMQKI